MNTPDRLILLAHQEGFRDTFLWCVCAASVSRSMHSSTLDDYSGGQTRKKMCCWNSCCFREQTQHGLETKPLLWFQQISLCLRVCYLSVLSTCLLCSFLTYIRGYLSFIINNISIQKPQTKANEQHAKVRQWSGSYDCVKSGYELCRPNQTKAQKETMVQYVLHGWTT